MANKSSQSGVSMVTLVFIIFLILKLTGNIDWSWWWVTAPLWGGFAIFIIIIIVALTIKSFFD